MRSLSTVNVNPKLKVDIVATSSVVPKVELQRGINKLEKMGFHCTKASNMLSQDFAYAGSDEERAQAFYQAATSDSDIVWAVRGGYGVGHLLHLIEQLDDQQKPVKQKILIGYSDLTALYQFVTQKWGWKVLHASMISSQDFHQMLAEDEAALMSLIYTQKAQCRWHKKPLTWISQRDLMQEQVISAPLFGGNLAVICSVIGTPWQLDFTNKILFIEEIAESWSKIDRMLFHLLSSGALVHCKAIVLGEFIHCRDASPKGLISEDTDCMESIREVLADKAALLHVFERFSLRSGLPICYTLPVGHCDHNAPLPMLANYRLSVENGLEFIDWP